MTFIADPPLVKYHCCEHCAENIDGCPNIRGHVVKCDVPGCDPLVINEKNSLLTDVGTELDIVDISTNRKAAAERELEREQLLEKMAEVGGAVPPAARTFLRLLAHPDVVEYTVRYFSALDVSTMCTTYESPWSCAREAEARYEHIAYGWVMGAVTVGIGDWWCDACRKKALGE